ncbi:hypothetical protein CFR78_14135 [Komagataeibacter rhaeticus]|nr:hypothetical protein [Komagataeibacter rhaeticus]KDU95155.1 hypothetical protein GLUCORHAEAF1_09915 [Komagataeibacter rhaeticus AF1]PYD52534.1 hypothetical protein CFR78_14135 [Komagataeibacter rhaeticus]
MLHSLLHIVSRKTRQTLAEESFLAEPLPIIISEIVRETAPDRRSKREKQIANFLCIFIPIGLISIILFSILLLSFIKKESATYSIILFIVLGAEISTIPLLVVIFFLALKDIVGFFRDVHEWPLLYAQKELDADRTYIERLKRSTLADLQTARRTYARKFEGLTGRATLLGGNPAKAGLAWLAVGAAVTAWQSNMKEQILEKWPSPIWAMIIIATSFALFSFLIASSAEKRVRALDLLDQAIEERKTAEEP